MDMLNDLTLAEVMGTNLNEEAMADLEEDYYEPDYDECGFNPYMGCYDFDC